MQYTHFSSKQKKILDDIKIIICEKKRQFKSSTSFESGETPYNILLMVRKECEVFLCTVSQSCQDSIFHMLEDNQF